MSATGPGRSSPSKSRTQKEKEKQKELPISGDSNSRLKTVVRRLPPNLPEEVFWQSVENWVTEDSVVWKMFYPGKSRKRLNKENIPSRAYIAFKTEELLALFSREYDGHLFRDKAGNESQAVVEFAPYQKIPTEKKKVDARNATIEKDEDYISFLESLKTPPANSEPLSLEALIAANQPPEPPKTTPLLEALKAQKSAQKEKEAIIRNHAHYKEIASKKEESKKGKAAAIPAAQKQSDTATPMSKKAAKKVAAAQRAAQGPPASAKSTGPTGLATSGSQTAPSGPAPGVKPARGRQHQGKASALPLPPAQPTSEANATIAESAEPAQSLPAAASRRTRPVVGLASRQFEAALSGAGVGPGHIERKTRRERQLERERDKETHGSTPAANKEQGKGKERKRREDRPAGGGSSSTVGGIADQGPKPPIIAQRSDGPSVLPAPPLIVQRDGQAQPPRILARPPDAPAGAGVVPPVPVEGAGGRGGSRRGRGRGRGMRGSG